MNGSSLMPLLTLVVPKRSATIPVSRLLSGSRWLDAGAGRRKAARPGHGYGSATLRLSPRVENNTISLQLGFPSPCRYIFLTCSAVNLWSTYCRRFLLMFLGSFEAQGVKVSELVPRG